MRHMILLFVAHSWRVHALTYISEDSGAAHYPVSRCSCRLNNVTGVSVLPTGPCADMKSVCKRQHLETIALVGGRSVSPKL